MTDRDRVSGIVLAGGRGSRFGSDKLAVLFEGRPLVHRPIEVLAAICREIVLVVGPASELALPRDLAVPLRIVRDDEPDAGPLAALVTALREVVGPTVLVAAGDMPALVGDVLLALLGRLESPDVEAAALRSRESVRPLPMALHSEVAALRAQEVRATGGSSLRSLLAGLRVAAIPEVEWRLLDPAGATLTDIDTPADLERALRGQSPD